MNLSTWWETLDPASQVFFGTCFSVAVVLGFSEIRYRIKRHRLGHAASPRKSKFGQMFWGIIAVWVLYYLHDRVPVIGAILSLPGRLWPTFNEHTGAAYLGLLAGIVVATTAASLYAALFIRQPASSVAMQPGFSGASVTVVRRTSTLYEED